MKLVVFIEWFNPTPTTDFVDLWYRSLIWAIAEHGLSLFAASVLAIRPFFAYISKSVVSLSSSLYSRRSLSAESSGRTGSSVAKSVRQDSTATTGSKATELHSIRVRSDVEVRSEYNGEGEAGHFVYTVDGNDSSRSLVQGGKKKHEAGDYE